MIRLGRAAMAGAAVAAVMASSFAISGANAESGRRICLYGSNVEATNYRLDKKVHVWAAFDDSKGGQCPTLRTKDWWNQQTGPFDQITCESLPAIIGENPFGEGADMCAKMADKALYLFERVDDDGTWDIEVGGNLDDMR